MARAVRIAGYGLGALVVLGLLAALWFREELVRLHAVNTLFDEDRIIDNFSNMQAAFLTTPVPLGGADVLPLPDGPPLEIPPEVTAWLESTAATGLVVLDRGAIRYEGARLGTQPEDLRISWSLAKSFLSALFGISVAQGEVVLDENVAAYAPLLTGGAYDGVTVREVLTMQSGVTFDEEYLDPRSDINRMGRVIALGGAMDEFAAALTERDRPPGEAYTYNSIDTHILAMVLRGATGRSLPDLLSERLIVPLGLEAEPYYLTDGEGVAFALGGLNLRLRDYARFGHLIAQEGRLGGESIVPADWIAESTSPQANTEPGKIRYGYQWWMPWEARPGEVLGRGFYGQQLYIDTIEDVVIVVTAADRRFREDGSFDRALTALRTLADAAVDGR